jgi:GAF domain-containing protein
MELAPPVPELLQHVTEQIPPAMQYPELCLVAIEYDGQIYGVPEAIGLPAQMTHGLYIGSEIMGRIYIAYTEKYDFLDEESALLGAVATRVSGYIENRRLFDQAQARARREQILRQVSDRIRGSVDVEIIMRTAAREVGRALGRPAFVYLGNGDSFKQPSHDEKKDV